MPIKLNGATNGSVELDVPAAVGSDLQITLPATAGEVVVKDGSGNITTTGSATFANRCNFGSSSVADHSGKFTNSDASSSTLYVTNHNGSGDLFSGRNSGNNEVINLGVDGTATFAGVLSVNRTISGDGCFHAKLNGTTKASIASDGTASFAGGDALIFTGGAALFKGTTDIGNFVAGSSGIRLSSAGSATFAKVDAVFNSSVDVGLNLRNSNTGTSARFYSGSSIVGSITVTGSATAFNTSSDYRLKANVVDIADGIARVKQLLPRRFNFIVDADTTVDGFLAHEAQTVVPEAVTGEKDATREEEYVVTPAVEEVVDEDGNVTTVAADAVMGTRTVPDHQGIDQSKLVPLLTAALQEAITKIETLETKVAALEAAS